MTHIPCDVSVAGKVTGKESGKSGLFHVSNRLWDKSFLHTKVARFCMRCILISLILVVRMRKRKNETESSLVVRGLGPDLHGMWERQVLRG